MLREPNLLKPVFLKRVYFYAGAVRPGGGLSVVLIIIRRLLEVHPGFVSVVVGDRDSLRRIQSAYPDERRLQVHSFLVGANSAIRSLVGKIWVPLVTCFPGKYDLVVTLNFWLPTFRKSLVYHVNLLNFTGGHSNKAGDWLRQADATLACRRSDINIFESAYLKNIATQKVRGDINNSTVLYVGFYREPDSSAVLPVLGKLSLVSSTQDHKDNKTAIRALRLLQKNSPGFPWELNVFGGQSSDQWNDLKAFSLEIGCGEAVRFHGPIDGDCLVKELQSSACLLCPSRVESFYMVAIEAMACSCPVVIVRSSSAVESVGSAGVLVDEGDERAMADAALRLCSDDSYRSKIVTLGLHNCSRFKEERLCADLKKILVSNDLMFS